MTRPADCSVEDWAKYTNAAADALDAMPEEGPQMRHHRINSIARAIIAEMERCAVLADQAAAGYSESASSLPTDHYKVPYRLHRQNAAREIAAAIRKATP